jgi:tRNA-specific 2-thiouridylase
LGFGDNGFALLKGIDMRKDQSYVLYVLSRGDLSRVILPLGQKTKEEVRKLSGQLNLPAAIRPESQEICFIGKGKCAVFLKYIAQPVEGPIRDAITGNIIGRHRGIHLYTIGQRKRLIAAGTPLYVVKIDSSANTIYVGPKALAMKREFRVRELNWLVNIDRFTKENRMIRPEKALSNHAAGASNEGFRATVKVRSTMRDEPATIQLMHDRAMVCFDELQWAPAPGQSAVFYCGETVLGGGVITD